ncbi:glycosyltransferase [Tsukamurella soli]|uniref:Glycosyltransferase n=1 Tax=Tsukamurella soli TaxID=644556 RepID=A0ABP8J1Q8_9ACTN
MTRVLAYTSPGRGHLFPMTPLLTELRDRGVEVHVQTLADEVERVDASGLHARAVDPRIEAIHAADGDARSVRDAFARSVRMFADRARLEVPDLRAAVDRVDPDFLLVDANTWGAMAYAESAGLPWACFSASPIPRRSPGLPPFGPGLAPDPSPAGRIRDAVANTVITKAITSSVRPTLNEIRRDVGLAPIHDADDVFRSPPILFLATAEPFEYRHADWDNLVYLGACDWDPPQPPPPWLGAITDPIVLVTTSSDPQKDEVLARRTLAALADEPVHVVATMPSGVPADLDVPSNATVVRFAAHGPILDRAVCAITHGGMGATQKALARGVPVVAVPFGRDQLEVARRVVVSGSGVRVPARRLRHPGAGS